MTYRPTSYLRRTALATAAVALLALTATSCATGPTDRKEVCDAYDSLSGRVVGIGAVIGNPVFWAAGTLADKADRYEGPEDLSADARQLDDISDSDETDMNELMNATRQTATLCGHPLGIGRTTPTD
ncbi:molybdenum ABC transporter substrate-binding protein [Streptomyces sp. J2-1]|uniref:molybdenum ABC transporter substrate-binding protein n=1 Tax=Streptomyces corallincola TaxID=2851888 RepID=UPI001C38EE44|nr:molybdenum ABC transporter substrate-binding protein [Streptomyces corallincola]MBV2354753.1 molybdenum ABC transporter substrate-binding protein [Streptomyces corallincola]